MASELPAYEKPLYEASVQQAASYEREPGGERVQHALTIGRGSLSALFVMGTAELAGIAAEISSYLAERAGRITG